MGVAGTAGDDAEAFAQAFLDLRFPDGHVERWLGPGSASRLCGEDDGMRALQTWAERVCEDFAFDIACDVARDYAGYDPREVDATTCSEVVIEWNATGS